MPRPVLRVIEWDGKTWDNPSEEVLGDLLASLSLRWRFMIVERLDREPEGQHYLQVYLNDDLSYQVEYREGGADRHFRAHVPRRDGADGHEPVRRVVAAWAFGQAGWRDALPWTPCPGGARRRASRPPLISHGGSG
jgi:hypothetical protein